MGTRDFGTGKVIVSDQIDIARDCSHQPMSLQIILKTHDEDVCPYCLLDEIIKLYEKDHLKVGKEWVDVMTLANKLVKKHG